MSYTATQTVSGNSVPGRHGRPRLWQAWFKQNPKTSDWPLPSTNPVLSESHPVCRYGSVGFPFRSRARRFHGGQVTCHEQRTRGRCVQPWSLSLLALFAFFSTLDENNDSPPYIVGAFVNLSIHGCLGFIKTWQKAEGANASFLAVQSKPLMRATGQNLFQTRPNSFDLLKALLDVSGTASLRDGLTWSNTSRNVFVTDDSCRFCGNQVIIGHSAFSLKVLPKAVG